MILAGTKTANIKKGDGDEKPRSVTYIFVWFVVYFINLNLAMTWFAYDDKYYFYCIGCILSGVYLKPQIDKKYNKY